jgi:hypothetical protein
LVKVFLQKDLREEAQLPRGPEAGGAFLNEGAQKVPRGANFDRFSRSSIENGWSRQRHLLIVGQNCRSDTPCRKHDLEHANKGHPHLLKIRRRTQSSDVDPQPGLWTQSSSGLAARTQSGGTIRATASLYSPFTDS